jgi:hypothetical protein
MPHSFGSNEFCKFLKKLDFKPQQSTGSSHIKYSAPKNLKTPVGIRPFITVMLGRKTYDPHTISCYKRDLVKVGVNKERLTELFG